jgi:hypothetical protein
MTDERVAEALAQLPTWAAQSEDAFRRLAEVLGAPVEDSLRDPTTLLPHVAMLLAELPLDELTDDDWKALHLQLVAFVAQVLIHRSGARWSVLADDRSVTGYWYVLERTDGEGRTRILNPFALVFDELKERPIEVTRMLATAELVVGAARPDWS